MQNQLFWRAGIELTTKGRIKIVEQEMTCERVLSTSCSAGFRKLYRFSATLSFFGSFQFVEQLSVHQAIFKFLCLDIHSPTPATSETVKKSRI